jgi:RNA polymerase sigma-70 factor (ECF subfamily)
MSARLLIVSSTLGEKKDKREPATLYLGDVLYAKPGNSLVPEAEWVALVHAIGRGQELALAELYQRAHRIVYTLVFRIVNSHETAQELTVDVFHEIWRRAAAYNPDGGSVIGWIANQARSRAIDRLRFDHRKKRVDPLPDESPAEADDLQDVIGLAENKELLRSALSVLTSEEREVIERAFFGEHTYAEVAAQLSMPLGTVKTRIRGALMKLRSVLHDKGGA